jgi:hypothetical protein
VILKPSLRWAWLIVIRWIIFLLVAVRIHYDFLILRQRTSVFYTRNLTFHWREL